MPMTIGLSAIQVYRIMGNFQMAKFLKSVCYQRFSVKNEARI